MEKSPKVIQLIIFKVGPLTPEEHVRKLKEMFESLKDQIPGLLYVQWGTNISVSHRSEGWDQGCLLEFRSVKARDGFHFHPSREQISYQAEEGGFDNVVVFEMEIPDRLEEIEINWSPPD